MSGVRRHSDVLSGERTDTVLLPRHYSHHDGTRRVELEAARDARAQASPATLAAMLAEWKLIGWTAMVGRQPEANDLLLPLPPADAERRRTREGEAIRTGDYAGKKWREVDLPMLGWRSRELYAGKSTFITLAIEDGANRDIIRDRVTHAKVRRDAFDGYDRGEHWNATCSNENANENANENEPGKGNAESWAYLDLRGADFHHQARVERALPQQLDEPRFRADERTTAGGAAGT
jgi:hypothetical protein